FWSAGCSIGCEPYTLAIILDELDSSSRHSILATDVDLPILARARAGTGYQSHEVQAVPPELLKKYLVPTPGGTFDVNPVLKRRITFRRHDLLTDRYPSGLDVIVCRNVVIYFNEEAKRHLYAGFANALRPGGLLFLGGSEMIMRSHDFGFRIAGTSIYEKAA
ncbi:MAG: CheR family methyltransferase, partial [Tepidiformaceae bacterium]